MEKIFELKSWNEFPDKIAEINEKYGQYKDGDFTLKNKILYRGQADSKWELKTTLERYSSEPWTIRDYARLAMRCSPEIESITNHDFSLPTFENMEVILQKDFDQNLGNIPCYSYWVYLRHHGFPSPLLDWTASPYIAAFFAFADQEIDENAAIYIYIETPEGNKTGWVGEQYITVKDPYVKTHKRHFLQQAFYSLCTQADGEEHYFCSHEKVFEWNDPDQDVLFKIIIPGSERRKVLSWLDSVNINYFSLFQTEDALMKTLAFKEIENFDN